MAGKSGKAEQTGNAPKMRSRAGRITRRTLLVGSVAVAGGVAFFGYRGLSTPPNPLHPEAGAALNPWLVISREGITIVVPRAEMGQGVQTTLAALVAEELDADLEAVTIIHGPPARAYYNAALSPRPYEQSLTPRPQGGLGQALAEAVPKIMSMQVTGGSTSTIDAFDRMRLAGASARLVLIEAAARRLGVPASALHTEPGEVVAVDGTRIPYGDLAEEAASIDPPRRPPLKPREEWRLLGKSQPRHDQLPKATGTATFGIDVRLAGMRFGSARTAPGPGARIEAIDTAAAEAMPGVDKVVTWEDGFGVIAANTWLAMQALDAVKVRWSTPDQPPDTAGVFARIAQALDEAPTLTGREEGDAEAALAEAPDQVIEASYRAPYLAHATMEPMNATVLYEPGRLEVWTGNQMPQLIARAAGRIAGVPAGDVVVHTPFLGGGFGRRSYPDAAETATRLALAMPGTPVQCTWSREQDMGHDFYRPGALGRFRARLEGGRIRALEARLAAQSTLKPLVKALTGFSFSPPDNEIVAGAADQPYAIEHVRVTGHAADLEIPVGFWRSVGASQNGFFHESFIDELAHAAGADPVAFRLAHIREAHPPTARALEEVARMAGWQGPTPAGLGRGAAAVWSFGTSVAMIVDVRDEGGRVRVSDIWIAADPGLVLDPANVKAQLFGAATYGLSAAILGEITFDGGAVVEQNFPDYDAMRMGGTPRFHIGLLENNVRLGGIGEPGTPPVAPALANALFDLTGKRLRALPLGKQVDFVT